MSDVTVPWEAFDETHPDHAWWVDRTARCLAGPTCSMHGETVVYHHCGDITTDIVCPHCGRWLVEVFSD